MAKISTNIDSIPTLEAVTHRRIRTTLSVYVYTLETLFVASQDLIFLKLTFRIIVYENM
jgi:hypothetical protein